MDARGNKLSSCKIPVNIFKNKKSYYTLAEKENSEYNKVVITTLKKENNEYNRVVITTLKT